MKTYLKKLTKTKFQAFLIVTITNIILLVGSLTGNIQLEGKIDEWMPAINILVQLVAGSVYQWVEGSIDKANVNGQQPIPPDNSGTEKFN